MSKTVLVVRPRPGLSTTLAAAKARGLNAIGYPLFEIEPVQWHPPDPASFDALLIGSANAIRHGGPAPEKLKDKPVYAVGKVTAQVAQEAGFEIAATGQGGLQNVLDKVSAPARLLRLSGEEHVALTAPEGVTMEERTVYRAKPLELPEPMRALHDLGLIVMLHSAAAARRFDAEARRLALHRERIELAVIGPRVASSAGKGWRAIHVSPAPNDAAMLEMIAEQCI
jgi:uroporphyrinogen-III synthase